MQNPAHKVIELLVAAEGAVTGLVSENPDASSDQALSITVDHPSGITEVVILNLGDVGQSSVEQRGGEGGITDDIAHGRCH